MFSKRVAFWGVDVGFVNKMFSKRVTFWGVDVGFVNKMFSKRAVFWGVDVGFVNVLSAERVVCGMLIVDITVAGIVSFSTDIFGVVTDDFIDGVIVVRGSVVEFIGTEVVIVVVMSAWVDVVAAVVSAVEIFAADGCICEAVVTFADVWVLVVMISAVVGVVTMVFSDGGASVLVDDFLSHGLLEHSRMSVLKCSYKQV
jgi:hypothetical protein